MPDLTQKEKNSITGFKGKAREFWGLWNSLNEKKNSEAINNPEIKQEYDRLMNKGLTIKNTVEKVTGLIDAAGNAYDSVKKWLNEKFTFNGIERENLGFIPLIPLTAIAISVAAMGKWISDAYQLNKKIEGVQKLIDQGMSPGLASQVINDMNPKGFFKGLSNVTTPLGLIGGGLLIFALMKRKK